MKNQAAFYLVLGLLAALSAWMLAPFLTPVLLAVLLGYLLLPVYDRLGRWIHSGDLRATLLILLTLFAVAIPLLFAVLQLSEQAPAVLRQDTLGDTIVQLNETLDRTLGRHVPLAENFAAYAVKVREVMVRAAPAIIGRVGTTALPLMIFLYTLFYVFTDGRVFFADFIRLIPLDAKMKPHLVDTIVSTMTGVLYGQVVTAAVQAGLAGIGYAVAGLPHLLLWTLLTLIASMLPVGGAALVWLPLAISRLLAGDRIGGWGLIIYNVVIVSSIDNVIKPKLIAGRAPLHPLAALFGVLGGLHFFGLTGFLIGPVVLGLLAAMLRFYRELPHYKELESSS